jgi:hypothetical protein
LAQAPPFRPTIADTHSAKRMATTPETTSPGYPFAFGRCVIAQPSLDSTTPGMVHHAQLRRANHFQVIDRIALHRAIRDL